MARTRPGDCCSSRSGGCSRPSCKRAKPISGDCQDGYGKKNFGGDIYEGHFKDGLPHGEGSWTTRDSTTVGTFERGTMVTGTVTISTKTTYYDREMEELNARASHPLECVKPGLLVPIELCTTGVADDDRQL